MAMKMLELVKGRQTFLFKYEVGYEGKVFDAFVDMVNHRGVDFDPFDAMVLAHQLGKQMAKEVKACLPKKVA
jgi:hypothetical protein